MSTVFPHPERVPASAIERLQRNLAALLAAIGAACDAGDPRSKEAVRWRRAEALLQEESLVLRAEADHFSNDDREPLLQHAAQLRLLAHRTDSYSTTFAPEAKAIADQRQLLVLTAWQIAAAASGSEAAGL